MAFAASISVLPRPPRLHSTPATMAAVSALPRPPRLPITSASPLLMRALHHRRRSDLTTAHATQQNALSYVVPVAATRPANEDETIFLVTVDVSDAPELVESYTTPGQSVRAHVPSSPGDSLKPAWMTISSAPGSGPRFDLLVRSVPNTTAGELCKLGVGGLVELGPCMPPGFSNPIDNLDPPRVAKTVLLFAIDEGISPIRALIEYGFDAKDRDNVKLYFGARDEKDLPLRDEIKKWEETGVKVEVVISEPVQFPFLRKLNEIIVDPDSTGAVLVGTKEMEKEVIGALTGHSVPQDKILVFKGWYPGYE